MVPAALTILALRLLLQAWGYCRAIHQGGERPVGVPLIEAAQEAAAREAETVSSQRERNND